MPGLLGKKFPTPVARPMWPFYTAGLIVAWGISSFAGFYMNTEEFKNDPRHPKNKA